MKHLEKEVGERFWSFTRRGEAVAAAYSKWGSRQELIFLTGWDPMECPHPPSQILQKVTVEDSGRTVRYLCGQCRIRLGKHDRANRFSRRVLI